MKLRLLLACSLLLSNHAIATDAFGYTFTTSSTGGPEFAFKDISATGTTIPVTTGNLDDGAATVLVGTPFPFYGQVHTELRFSTNGYLSTDTTDSGFNIANNPTLPTLPTIGGGARIYPLHDDIVMTNGTLHYQYFPEGIASSMFVGGFPFRPRIGVSVFQWTDAYHFESPTPSSPTLFSFQALLFDDGSIYFTYDNRNPETGLSSTTGIQNVDATSGLLVAANTAGSIPGDFAVAITPPHSVVTNTNDTGPGSLRQAIADSPSPGLITFDPSVFNQEDNKTITLTSGQLDIPTKTLAIEATDICGVTLDAGGISRVISNASGGNLFLNSLNITGGSDPDQGAGILNIDSLLNIQNSAIYRNDSTSFGGGGIYHSGSSRASIFDSTIALNTANFGGGIWNQGESLLRHCTIANNTGRSGTAGIVHESLNIEMEHCLVSNPDSTIPSSDIGGVGGTWTGSNNNFIRNNNSPYSSTFPAGLLVGTSASPLEPLLVGDSGAPGDALINNGGPTLTLMPLPGSPVINAGVTSPYTDQRGVLNFGNRDIGAVETTWGEGIVSATPPEFDVTTPGDPITVFPPENFFSPPIPPANAIDNNPATSHFSTGSNINSGYTITPRLGASQLTGISITSNPFADRSFDPMAFILLGSNDLACFEPIASGQLSFASASQTLDFQFATASPSYRHYRVIYPETLVINPVFFPEIAEIRLVGTPLDTTTPRILDFQVAQNSGNPSLNDVTLTFTSQAGKLYGIQASGSLLFSGFASFTGPTASSYTTTKTFTYNALDAAFFRVDEQEDP